MGGGRDTQNKVGYITACLCYAVNLWCFIYTSLTCFCSCQYPLAANIDHSWVAFEWATDCGLPHLTEMLTANLVDGLVLNSLSKDDIRKLLKVTKKIDQLSFLSGVELLRMHEFRREAIQEHRRSNLNPLYWTNRDVSDWLRDIELEVR